MLALFWSGLETLGATATALLAGWQIGDLATWYGNTTYTPTNGNPSGAYQTDDSWSKSWVTFVLLGIVIAWAGGWALDTYGPKKRR